MSLNGLDDVAVTQAYQGALAEAGGWFLLKYSARDAVEVLTRGTGGAAEVRGAVAQYPDKSPLYCFMLYRRRKVLIRYVPEGTSRLLQARVAVHFLTVTEKFTPHDIALSITTPEELSEAALASACALHTAAPSSSSSSGSSRHQKLSWIQEAAEEGNNPGGEDSSNAPRPTTAASTIPTILEPTSTIEEEPLRNVSVTSDSAISVPLILEEKHVEAKPMEPPILPTPELVPVAKETTTVVPGTPESDLTELQATLSSYEKLFEDGPEPRASSQTARPNYDDLYEHYYAQYSKPKVKLGPRPRPSLEGKRPSTSGSGTQSVSRPKSSLPAGLRSATKKAAEVRAEKPKDISVVPALALPPPPPIPKTPEAPTSPTSLSFTARSPASVRSMPVSTYSSHYRSTGMTQERTRLMKALELRKKQQKAQVERQEKLAAEAAVKAAAVPEPSSEVKSEKAVEKEFIPVIEVEKNAVASEVKQTEKSDVNGEPRTSFEDEVSSSLGVNSSLGLSSSLADSDDLNSTASVSSPISAQTQGSSGAPSTRPSSLSEDELTNAARNAKHDTTQDDESPDMMDEEQSVDSQPTIVPESRTPIPSLVHPSSQSGASPVGLSPEPLARASDEDLSVSALPTIENGTNERRRSKRHSMLIMPTDDDSLVQEKRRNRESVIMPSSKRQSWYETKERHRAMLEPLQLSAENSEAEYLSDDSFMEELQTATVHQAQPMSVSKSPITPWFPRKASDNDMANSGRSAYAVSLHSSTEHLQRKTSGPWPPQFNSEQPILAKKINVSSGISQRIKALAEKSTRESSPPSSSHGTLETPSSTLAQRKSSFFATTPLETSPNSKPTARLGNPAFLGSSAASTPDRQAIQIKPIKATVYNVQRAHQKPESVQVTARIVRDERVMKPALAMPTETTPLDLHQSPLIIDHNKPSWTPRSPTRGRPEPASPKAPSTSHSRDQSNGPSTRTSMEGTWKSFGRRMSESKSIHSHEAEDRRDEKKDKKESRTSKMFKRMSSSISSMPWKNSSNNLSLPENDLRSTSLASLREPPPPVHVGDLNVQFPDTLLWKRRYVEIDPTGNLVLSPSRSNEKGVVKRFHLSDFRTPYPPDQDRQELPNSVVLDFVDGRTLQVACETYIAQAQVLQILREAHDAWLAYNQSI